MANLRFAVLTVRIGITQLSEKELLPVIFRRVALWLRKNNSWPDSAPMLAGTNFLGFESNCRWCTGPGREGHNVNRWPIVIGRTGRKVRYRKMSTSSWTSLTMWDKAGRRPWLWSNRRRGLRPRSCPVRRLSSPLLPTTVLRLKVSDRLTTVGCGPYHIIQRDTRWMEKILTNGQKSTSEA